MSQQPLKPVDVAALFAVSVETVKNWAEAGKLPGFQTPSGRWRFPREGIERLLEQPKAAS